MLAVRLIAFDPERHRPILVEWLNRPHVARWWGDANRALADLDRHPLESEAMIVVEGRPVGFVCWHTPTEEELATAGLDDLPADLIDVDILIGESDALGRGVGPAALGDLLARLRADGIRIVGLAAAVANARALRAYEKAGFRPFRDFHEAGQDMRYMVQELSRSRRTPGDPRV